MHRRKALTLIVCLGVAIVACKDDSGSASGASTAEPTASTACPDAAVASGLGPATIQVSDGDSVAILLAAIGGEADRAQLALTSAAESPVKDFAKKLRDDNGKAKSELTALAAKLGITPPTNEMATSLQQAATNALNGLGGVQGGAFDQAYVDGEVLAHATLLGLLDATLLASTVSSDYRSWLTNQRAEEVAHLRAAQELQRTVDAGGPADNGGGDNGGGDNGGGQDAAAP
jgi:putative membrane protein